VPDHLETEHKYEADTGFVLPELGGLPGVVSVSGPETFRLDATYYDTADLALHRHEVTLRRRTGGPDEGWHLKLPVRPGTRLEVHEPLGDSAAPQVPQRLSSLVEQFTAGGPLHPIAILSTERTVHRLSGTAGTAVAEVADDRVTARRLPRSLERASDPPDLAWREIEVESDLPELLAAAGPLLRAAGARPAPSASKVARVLGDLSANS
jgi:hypothetical protein